MIKAVSRIFEISESYLTQGEKRKMRKVPSNPEKQGFVGNLFLLSGFSRQNLVKNVFLFHVDSSCG